MVTRGFQALYFTHFNTRKTLTVVYDEQESIFADLRLVLPNQAPLATTQDELIGIIIELLPGH